MFNVSPSDVHANSYLNRRIQRVGVDGPPPDFLICYSIWKRFYLYGKPLIFLNKMRYILWVVALLEACDITNNGRHLARYLGFLPRIRIIFCALHENNIA